MPRKGEAMGAEVRAKSSRSWALRNALTEAGEAVLTTAEIDPTKVAAVATARLAAIREQFGDDIFRILPPERVA